ncbi:MAG: hypothetical protein ACMG51_09730 [Ginsengibacter sp.]
MELSTLKSYRKIIPGATFLLFSIPAYQFFSNTVFGIVDISKFTIEGLGAVLAFGVGTVFSNVKIRSLWTSNSHKKITENIKNKLLQNGLTRKVTEEKYEEIRSSCKLMHIFYYFVDKDMSLKEKAKLVRDNGLIWTSTADIVILAFMFVVIYLLLIAFFGLETILVAAAILISSIGLLSALVLHPNAIADQIELSNNQIDYIVTHYKQELEKKVNAIFD